MIEYIHEVIIPYVKALQRELLGDKHPAAIILKVKSLPLLMLFLRRMISMHAYYLPTQRIAYSH